MTTQFMAAAFIGALTAMAPIGAWAQIGPVAPTVDDVVLPESPINAGAALKFEKTTVDYGRVAEGEMVVIDFKVTNISDRDVVFRAIRPSCGCTTSGDNPTGVKAGATETIRVKLDTRGRPGYQAKAVTVETDDPAQPSYYLRFQGTVTQDVYTASPMIDFGTMNPGEEIKTSFSFFSTLEKDLSINQISVSNPAIKAVFREAKPFESGAEKGKQYFFDVTIPPTIPQGDVYFNVTVVTDWRNPIRQNFRGKLVGELEFSPKQLMAVMEAGTTAESTVTIRSRTTEPFRILEIAHNIEFDVHFEHSEEVPRRHALKATFDPKGKSGHFVGEAMVTIQFDGRETPAMLEVPIRILVRPPAKAAPNTSQGN